MMVWPLTGTRVSGASFAMTSAHGIWAAVLYDSLLVMLALAASIPQREPPVPGVRFAVDQASATSAVPGPS